MIAEDQSDVDVVVAILDKLVRKRYVIRKFLGHGCGKIRSKCRAWAGALRDEGCTRLIVIHDLDDRHLATFRQQMREGLGASPIARHIVVIPVREVEAWLLADIQAVARVAKPHRAPKKIPNPEALARPKEHLRDLIYRLSGERVVYINTVHNRKIAEYASLANLRRCVSFRPLQEFVVVHFR